MTLIRMGSGVKRAIQAVAGEFLVRKSGLLVPPDYVAGKHFKGFSGYDSWIQTCIATSLRAVRTIRDMPDDLSEITSLVVYQDEPCELYLTLKKHAEAVGVLEKICEMQADAAAARGCAIDGGLSDKAKEQVRRANNERERGSLLVVALRHVVDDDKLTADLKLSVSCWGASSMEEALAVPARKYHLG